MSRFAFESGSEGEELPWLPLPQYDSGVLEVEAWQWGTLRVAEGHQTQAATGPQAKRNPRER